MHIRRKNRTIAGPRPTILVPMGSPTHHKERAAQLRNDVDDMYQLLADTNASVHRAHAAIRGLDMNVRRYQKVNGQQFGILTATLRQHGRRLDGMDARFDAIDKRLASTDSRLENLEGRLEHVEDRLENLEGRLEHVESRLEHVEGRLERVEGRLERVDSQLEEFNGRLGGIDDRLAELVQILTTRLPMG
ncbi:hypothetical protein [Nocardia sp. alder85J]|uniref:hypothetical protein n=1 Tax=Nocardia sp. alder85J TaxID=2862949 RepID=UPI001CD74276|nr:hypothetical protein [Nocardia sp. alder85J]MCX4097223.1 hypothetical protein [Nocardia sp. alder85J]